MEFGHVLLTMYIVWTMEHIWW